MVVAGTGGIAKPQELGSAGLGTQDDSGLIYKHVLKVVKPRLPRIVIMENVKGLMERHSATLLDITTSLQNIWDYEHNSKAYKVFIKLLNSCNFGVPQ